MPKQFLLGIIALCVFSGCGTFDLSLSTPERDFDPNRHALYAMGDKCGVLSNDKGQLYPGSPTVPFQVRTGKRPGISESDKNIIWTRVSTLWWFPPTKENCGMTTFHRLADWEVSCQQMIDRAAEEIPIGSTLDLYGASRGATVVLHCTPELARAGYQIGYVALLDGGDTTAWFEKLFHEQGRPELHQRYADYLELVRADDPRHNGRFDQTVALAQEEVVVFNASYGNPAHQALTESFRDDPRVTFVTLRGTHGGISKEAVQYVADLIPPYSETQQ